MTKLTGYDLFVFPYTATFNYKFVEKNMSYNFT